MWSRGFLIFYLTILFAIPAFALDRPFPATAKRGTMSPGRYPEIVINGNLRSLSPGARIWNQDNLIEVPAALRGSDFVVNYTEDDQGAIDRVWILTREEANRTPPK